MSRAMRVWGTLLLLAGPVRAHAAESPDGATPPAAPEEAEPEEADPGDLTGSAVRATLVLRVSDKKASAAQAIALAREAGGWFTRFDPNQVVLRVPTPRSDAVLDGLAGLGELVARDYQREDHSQELALLDKRIEGREDVLQRYRTVLESSQARNIVTVERQITNAIASLEQLKGRRRYLRNQLDYATLAVSFRFRDRTAPRRDGSSSFAWLNTMNMADLLSDFQNGVRASRSRADAPTPVGFAPYRRRGRFRAVTPDDVVFRIRSARNKPKADLDFWKEALLERQKAAGYTVLSEEMMGDGGTYVLTLGAANGPRDQTYVIGLRVDGRHLILAEATGEAEVYAGHADAVEASLDAMR
jgi:hypothetical protein